MLYYNNKSNVYEGIDVKSDASKECIICHC